MKTLFKVSALACLAIFLAAISSAFGAVPVIYGFTPASGSNGTTVTIGGTNFATVASNNIVYFGAVRGAVTAAGEDHLSVTVPAGATYAPITVLVNGLVAYSSKPFQPTYSGTGAAFDSSSLGPRLDLPMPQGPQRAVIADLDGDGKPDLIVNNVYSHIISLFRNISDGGDLTSNSFAARVDLPPVTSSDITDNPYGITVGDVDGDGKLDIVTFDRSISKILVYRNISTTGELDTNSFAPPVSFDVGSNPRGVVVADLDGDGRPDILCSDADSGAISVLHNIGTAGIIDTNSFEPHVDFAAGNTPADTAVGDLDGDGKPEIVAVNANDSTVSIYRNQTTPGVINSNSFAAKVDLPTPSTPICVALGDLDGDGKIDVIVGTAAGNSLSVFRNIASAGALLSASSFEARVDFPLGGWGHTIALGDLNGDGKTDIAVVTELNSALSLFENLAVPHTFTSNSLAPRVDYATGYNAWGVAISDLNGDGRPDIVFANAYDNTLSVYQNTMTGSAQAPVITTQPVSQTVNVGSDVTFSVAATGTAPLSYQWWKGAATISGATSSSLTLSNVQASAAGTYYVVVSNAGGSTTSSNAVLTVTGVGPSTNGLVVPNYCTNTQIHASGGEFNSVLREQTVYNASEFPPFPIVISEIRWRPDQDAGGPISTTISNLQIHLSTTRSNADQLSSTFAQNIGADDTVVFDGAFHLSTYFITLSNGTTAFDISLPLQTPFTYDPSKGNLLMDFRNFTGCNPNEGNFLNVAGGIDATSRAFTFDPNGTSASVMDTGGGVLQIIYSPAGGSSNTAPVITKQPTNQTVNVGSTVSFSVTASGTAPLHYQWWQGSNSIPGATISTLTITNVQLGNAGTYHVTVTNAYGSTNSADATLTVVLPNAIVLLPDTSASGGSSFDVPIILVAKGNENALSFSLGFNPARLSYSDIALGSDASNALILPNVSQASNGEIGIQLALPPGETFAAGTQEVARVTFNTPILTGTQAVVTTISFTDQPIARLLSDAQGQPLASSFVNGTVSLLPTALEGDASPVPTGDGNVNLFDWVQVGRFVAGLDTITNGSEFQKVDCAPRNTLGDGQLKVTDWVQAGRYAAGLDPLTVAGGPTGPSAPAIAKPLAGSVGSRQVVVANGSAVKGLTMTLPVSLQAQGNESALAFSLNFDPTALSFLGAVKGSAASSAALFVNTNQAASGQLAIVLCLPAGGSHFAPGTDEIARVTFTALAPTTNSITFADQPVLRSISDTNAAELTADYLGNSIAINPPPTVGLASEGAHSRLSWPVWAGDFSLQAAGSLTPPITWTNVPVTLQTNGDNIEITLPASDQQTFFRLYHP